MMDRMIFNVYPSSFLRKVITALVLTSIEAFLSVFCILVGVPILLRPEALAPDSVLSLLPGWTIYPWAMCVTLGGFITFLGISFSEYRIERIGVLLLGSTVGVYAFALLPLLPSGFAGFVMFSLFALAMAARYWVLGKLLKIQNLRLDVLKEEKKLKED